MEKEVKVYNWKHSDGRLKETHRFVKYTRDDGTVVFFVDGIGCDMKSGNEQFKEWRIKLNPYSVEKTAWVEKVSDIDYAMCVGCKYDPFTWAIDDWVQQAKAEQNNKLIEEQIRTITGTDCFTGGVLCKFKDAKGRGENISELYREWLNSENKNVAC